MQTLNTYGTSTSTFRKIAAAVILVIAVALTSVGSADAQRGTRDAKTGETTEAQPRKQKLRGEAEYLFVNYADEDILAAMRMDVDTPSSARTMVRMFSDPYLVEDSLDMFYEGSVRLDRDLGNCTASEFSDYDGLSMFIVVCADGRYVNTTMSTDEDVAIEGMEQMMDGNVPAIDGFTEVED